MKEDSRASKPIIIRPAAKLQMMVRTIVVSLMTLVLLMSGSLMAQSGRSTISGRVVDPNGANIAKAKVVVTNIETDFAVSLVTNDQGLYEVTQLLPGKYQIEAQAAGFVKMIRRGITLVAGSPISVDLSLSVGTASTETVVVTAEAPLINTDPTAAGQVLTNEIISNTPVSGANASLLVKTAQGVQSTVASNYYMAGNLNATGNVSNVGTAGQIGKNEFYLDGAPNSALSHKIAYNASTDEVSELKTETSGLDASLGKTLGISIITTSKNGTNAYHGGVREMYYDRRWEAMSHFAAANYVLQTTVPCANPASAACALAKSKFGNPGVHEHNSGANLGGPIFIPHVFNGKNRLFFFGNITRDAYSDAQYAAYTVPTAAERLGDFSDLPQAGCSTGTCGAYTIYDPLTVHADTQAGRYIRNAFPGNAIPSGRLNNPMATFMNKYLPLPNVADANGFYSSTGNFGHMQINPQKYMAYLLRVDFTPGQKDRFFVRLSKTSYQQNQQYTLLDDMDTRVENMPTQLLTGGWVHMFTDSAILDTSVGYTQYADGRTYPGLMGVLPSAAGLPTYLDSMAALGGFSQVSVVTRSGYTDFGANATPMSRQRTIALRSGLTVIHGNNTFSMGGEVRQQMNSAVASGNTSGLLTFDNSYTRQYSDSTGSPQSLGLSYAAYDLGIPSTTQFDVNTPYVAHNPYYSVYFQDSKRVNPKLTLSLGMRFEYEYGPVESHNREVTYFDPTASLPIATSAQAAYAANYSTYKTAIAALGLTVPSSTITVQGGSTYAGVNGASNRRFDNNYRVLPRIGFAYQISPKMVIRGGYGLFFDTTNVMNQSINQNGFSRSTIDSASTDFGQTWTMGNPSTGVSPVSDPFPTLSSGSRYLKPVGSSLGASAYLGSSYTFYPKNYKPARQQRWQADFEKQMGSRDAIVVGYTGSWTDRMEWSQNLNSVPAAYFTGGNVLNPNTAALAATVTNPFSIGNFASLQTSDPLVYTQISSLSTFTASKIALSQLLKPYPWMTGLNAYTNLGQSIFHQVTIQYRHSIGKGFHATVNYQRSFQYDTDWQANTFDKEPTREPSNNTRPSRLTATAKLELPFGHGQRWLHDGILSKVFGGQTLDFGYEAQQGPLIEFGNIIYTGDPTRLSSSLQLNRPQYVLTNSTAYVQWLNPANVDTVAAHQLQGYNLRVFPKRIDKVREMGMNNLNANYQRTVSIVGRVKFIARFEAIDLLNHRYIGLPNVTPTDSKYGQVTGDNGAFGRWIQIQGKLTF